MRPGSGPGNRGVLLPGGEEHRAQVLVCAGLDRDCGGPHRRGLYGVPCPAPGQHGPACLQRDERLPGPCHRPVPAPEKPVVSEKTDPKIAKRTPGKCGVHKTVDSYSSLHGCGCSCFFLIYDNMEPNKSTNCIFMRCCLSGLKCQYSKYTSIFGGYKR